MVCIHRTKLHKLAEIMKPSKDTSKISVAQKSKSEGMHPALPSGGKVGFKHGESHVV